MSFAMFALLIVAALLSNAQAQRTIEYCFAEEKEPYVYMGTKTAYDFIQGHTTYPPVPNCEPVQLWALIRHGARYPENRILKKLVKLPEIRDKILENHKNNLTRLCDTDIERLKEWKLDPNLSFETADTLAPQGILDMKLLAQRLKQGFPSLLQPNKANVTAENYKFRTTNTPRASLSMDEFMNELLGSKTAVRPEFAPENDTLLAIYKHCPHWQYLTKIYRHTDEDENEKFALGPEWQKSLRDISKRLGFEEILSTKKVKLIYDACRYEKSWYVDKWSPWCAALNKEEFLQLEYLEDLDYYYYCGPGRAVNLEIGCPPFQDLFRTFENTEAGGRSARPKGIFYFAHSTALQMTISAFGFKHDKVPINSKNYAHSHNRNWRTSLLGAFSTNLVAAFYKCNDPRSPNKVMLYHSEQPVQLPGCDNGLCDWEHLKATFGQKAASCDLSMCWADEKDRATVPPLFRYLSKNKPDH